MKMSEKVIVTHADGPHRFFVYREQFIPHEKTYLDILNEIGENSIPTAEESVEIGKVYLVKKPITDDQWIRVKILRKSDDPNSDFWISHLLDYGNDFSIHLNYLKTTHVDFIRNLEPRAHLCQLVHFEEPQNLLYINMLFNFQVANR